MFTSLTGDTPGCPRFWGVPGFRGEHAGCPGFPILCPFEG